MGRYGARVRDAWFADILCYMIVRGMNVDDIEQIRCIHEKFYKEQFELPDFIRHYLCAFVVEEDDKIIVAGGIRTILESVILTDKDVPVKKRQSALNESLQVSNHIARINEYSEFHAFIQEKSWMNRLKKSGFRDTVGKALVIGV